MNTRILSNIVGRENHLAVSKDRKWQSKTDMVSHESHETLHLQHAHENQREILST